MNTNGKSAKVVFFEDVASFHYPFIRWYAHRGHEIRIFDFHCDLKRRKWLRRLINDGTVERIYIKPNTPEHGEAIDQTDVIHSHLRNQGMVRTVASLCGSRDADVIFKKSLVREVFKSIYINRHLAAVKDSSGARTLCFFDGGYTASQKLIERYGTHPMEPLGNVRIIRWAAPFLLWASLRDKIKYSLGALAFTLSRVALLILGKLFGRTLPEPVHFQNAIAIDTPYQVANSGERGFDFLLDHAAIHSQNTVFLLNIPIRDEWLKPHREKGYVFFEPAEHLRAQNLWKVRHDMAFTVPAVRSALRMFLGWGSSALFFKACCVSIQVFVEWKLIRQHLSFDNYVYTNQETVRQCAMNAMIRSQGGASWNYACFLGGGYVVARRADSFDGHRHIIWSFLNSDHYIGVNDDAVRYNKLHHQNVLEYHSVGSVYSEMVRRNMAKTSVREFVSQNFHLPVRERTRIVSFFDTSFVDSADADTTFQDCIGFYEDIQRFVSEHPDFLIVIKPSKDESYFVRPDYPWSSPQMGPKVIRLWNALKAEPRVLWLGGSAFENIRVNFSHNNRIMAVSDLVVTHCMSSPTAEALGARKKALWYESGDKHRGLLYDQIPNLIVHGYEELKARAQALLYDVTESEYNDYLDRHVGGKVEAQLDGMALSRFRELLVRPGRGDRSC